MFVNALAQSCSVVKQTVPYAAFLFSGRCGRCARTFKTCQTFVCLCYIWRLACTASTTFCHSPSRWVTSLLLLHVPSATRQAGEWRHCFYYRLPLAKLVWPKAKKMLCKFDYVSFQSNYSGAIDDMDPDSNVIQLNKDLSSIEESLHQSLQPHKFRSGTSCALQEYARKWAGWRLARARLNRSRMTRASCSAVLIYASYITTWNWRSELVELLGL